MLTELRLTNNVGLLTKGTKSVELTFKELVNIFMGRNGYGKTSILKECHPLPPDNADYAKGGYKYARWDVSPQEFYILESHTGSASTHSFKRNGVEELNTGGTLTVQKELCREYFGLTPQLVKYLNGCKVNDLFTMLSTAARKQIIMEMYPNDTRYAMTVYNKIKAELRNCQGALKNQHKRLAEENQRKQQLMETSLPELEAKIESLDTRIKEAMVLSGALSHVNDVSEELQLQIKDFVKLTRDLVIGSVVSIEGPEALVEKREQARRIMAKSNTKVLLNRAKLADLMETLSGVNYITETPEVLEEQKAALEAVQQLDTQAHNSAQYIVRQHFGDISDKTVDLLVSASSGLIPLLEQVVLASSENVTLVGYNLWLERLEAVNNQGRTLKFQAETLHHDLKHFDAAEDLECPECKHGFKPGFDVKDIEVKREELVRLRGQLKVASEEKHSLESRLRNDEEFYTSVNKIMSTVRYLDDEANTLHDIMIDNAVGYRDSSPLINALKAAAIYREKRDLIKQHETEIQSLSVRIESLRRNNIAELTRQCTELEAILASEERTLRSFTEKMNDIEAKLDEMRGRDTKINILETLRQDILDSFKDQGKYILLTATNNAIQEWVPVKDQHMQMLIRGRSAESVIQSIEEDIERLEIRCKRLQLLQDTICPNKGMIGKMMEDFIKTLCCNMNSIIRDVFTTPLYVLPCKNSKGALDYRFPVINSVDGKPSKDVTDCSGGEQDIINLAFRMVLNRYKARNGFPLVLDEVGVKLDAFHQQRLFDYILNISTNGEVNQILMVSHFFAHTSMFKKANVVALNSEGITVPTDANTNAKFK